MITTTLSTVSSPNGVQLVFNKPKCGIIKQISLSQGFKYSKSAKVYFKSFESLTLTVRWGLPPHRQLIHQNIILTTVRKSRPLTLFCQKRLKREHFEKYSYEPSAPATFNIGNVPCWMLGGILLYRTNRMFWGTFITSFRSCWFK